MRLGRLERFQAFRYRSGLSSMVPGRAEPFWSGRNGFPSMGNGSGRPVMMSAHRERFQAARQAARSTEMVAGDPLRFPAAQNGSGAPGTIRGRPERFGLTKHRTRSIAQRPLRNDDSGPPSTSCLLPPASGRVAGEVRVPPGLAAPGALGLIFRSASDAAPAVPEFSLTCPGTEGRFACEVPAGELDLGLQAPGFAPHAFPTARSRPRAPSTLGILPPPAGRRRNSL